MPGSLQGRIAGLCPLGARQYRLREFRVPVLPAGCPSIRILHLSICTSPHVTPTVPPGSLGWRSWSQIWWSEQVTSSLRIPESRLVADALHRLRTRPGVFVFGSNDVFGAKPINPTKYFRGPSQLPKKTRRTVLDTARLREVLASRDGVT